MSASPQIQSGPGPEETVLEQPHARPPHPLPESIGPYHIIEVIGEGGMGVVYKGEQRDPVRRVAAIKVIKLGMDTREVVARFDAERQALALMSHPNVAKVFEAGSTEQGRPYFAMEFVPGVSITHYCDTAKLTTRERLELFIPVCQAVQHAHQKGIIHRDLKPSNILVTLVDGKPVPKVIDFGVAKATSIQLTQHTLFTQTGTVIGTLEYMSPEQATSSGLDVDTRTDVYSLGVILYQLLTGSLPFEPDTLRKASAEQLVRIIQDTNPPKPSARLTNAARRADTTEIARRHGTDPRSLRRDLQGDLDWIILKAIEKDRTRRYETANGLAMDLRRHLADEPVLARPPGSLYRLTKFWKRHRVSLAATALIILAVILGSFTTGYAVVQRHKRIAKESEATVAAGNANHISDLFQESLSLFNSAGLSRTARQTLDQIAYRLDRGGLEGNPLVEARVRALLARNYVATGFYQRAVPQFRAALDLKRNLYDPANPEIVTALNELADALLTENQFDSADHFLAEAARIEQQNAGSDPETRAKTLDMLGSVQAARVNWRNAQSYFQQAMELRQPPSETRGYADSLSHKADVLLHANLNDRDGLQSLAEAKDLYEDLAAGQPPGYRLGPMRRMLRSAIQRNDWKFVEKLSREDLPATDVTFMAELVDSAGRLLESNPQQQWLYRRRGAINARLGRFPAAREDLAKAAELNPQDSVSWHLLLPILLHSGNPDLYRSQRDKAITIFETDTDPQRLHVIAKSCMCLPMDTAQADKVLGMAQRALDAATKRGRVDPFLYQSLGMAEFRALHPDKAIPWLKRSRDHVYAYRDVLADFFLAMAYADSNDVKSARASIETGMRLWESSIPQPGTEDLEQPQDWLICYHAREEALQRLEGLARSD